VTHTVPVEPAAVVAVTKQPIDPLTVEITRT